MGATPSGSYFFSPAASGQQPYVYFAQSATTQTPFDVYACLDEIFAGAAPIPLPSEEPFELQTAGAQQCTAPLSYQVHVAGGTSSKPGPAWTFTGAPLRTALCQAFDSFLDDLDAASLKPDRLRLIRSLMAQLLPLTFAETLYFRYGLDPVARQVDLAPEMRLRIDFQAHQSVDPGASLLNGFVGSGTSHVDLGELAGTPSGVTALPSDGTLAFDRFLGMLQGMSVTASGGGGGGAIDLQGAAYQMLQWRLVYPQNYPSSADTGFVGAQGNPALIGAPTRAALNTATTAFAQGGVISSPAVGAYFRGRVAIIPEIPVYVQGERRYVSIGTTIRDLVGGLAPLSRIQSAYVDFPTQAYWRPDNRLWAANKQIAWGVSASEFSALTLSTTAGGYQWYGDALDSLDLPVLGGDVFSIALPGA